MNAAIQKPDTDVDSLDALLEEFSSPSSPFYIAPGTSAPQDDSSVYLPGHVPEYQLKLAGHATPVHRLDPTQRPEFANTPTPPKLGLSAQWEEVQNQQKSEPEVQSEHCRTLRCARTN